MSPEQAEGLPAQPSGDVYALGAALCELLGGGAGGAASSPVDGASDRLLALPADAPPELVAIARRCLQTVAADRYPTAVELADDLGRWMSGQRVLAHEYRPREILGRLVRAWRAPLLVAAAALVLLGGVAAVGIERTLREQVRAEENLALALALQARQALSEYRNPEAVVLAAHSLRLAESPEARGVLAGAFHEQALLLDRQPLPAGCQYQGVLSRNGDRIACVVDGKVEVWRFGPLRRELAIEVQVDSAPVWVGDRLFLSRTQAAEWVDPDGTRRTVATGGLPLPSLDGVYLVSGPLVAHVDLDGSFRQFDTCPSTRASITVGDGQLMVGCADGLLRTYTRDGVMTRERLVSEGPPDWASVGHAGGKLLIGGFDGSVQTYDLETGAWSPPVPGGLGAVRAVIAVPGLEQLLVLAERGGPRVFSAAIGGWTGSLPRGVAMIRPGTQAGEVLTVGEFLDRWQLPPQPEPHILPFTAGVSHVAIAPAGDRVAVALGTGEIVERRMSDGGVSGTWSWSDEVAKCVVYLADDRLVAGAMGGGGRYLLRSGETVPLDKPAVLRRVGRFADGGFWALAYGESLQFDAKGVARPLGAGPDPIDGGSSPDGRLAVVVDGSGDIWQGDGTGWTTVARVAGAIAVDVGDGGSPLVAARRREVCVGTRCTAIEDDVVDVAVHGDLVAVGTLSGDVHVLSAATGASRALLRGHQSRIAAVEFAPGGHWLVSGSWDHTARVWDLRALDEAADSLAERGQSRWGLGLDAALRGG
jgi:WD40 repeat protein